MTTSAETSEANVRPGYAVAAIDAGANDRAAHARKLELLEGNRLKELQALLQTIQEAAEGVEDVGLPPPFGERDRAALEAIRYQVQLARVRYELADSALKAVEEEDHRRERKRAEQAQSTILEAQADALRAANAIQEQSSKDQSAAMAETNKIYRGMAWLTVVIMMGTLIQAGTAVWMAFFKR